MARSGHVTERVLAADPVSRARIEILDRPGAGVPASEPALVVENAPPFDKKGMTFLEAVMHGVGDALDADPRTFVFGEDVGGKYGNAFLLLRPLLEKHGDRILNSTLAEGAVLGACIGAALAGFRPIGEMQFNDFVATGFNQLVNNAAKIRYRWGASVPMVVRMPWGGLRHAGPYHSQNTEPWFYRTPGLKIVVPSTPFDARALMASAVADPDPVLYYEHIALYRDPRIKQKVDPAAPSALPVGTAALRRAGDDLAIVSYGAYVHTSMRVADRLAADGIQAAVLDLRWLSPLDRRAVLAVARRTGRVLIVHEDSRTGGIGESSRPSFKRKPSSGSTLRSGLSLPSTRPFRTRRRSRRRSCQARPRSKRPPGCSCVTDESLAGCASRTGRGHGRICRRVHARGALPPLALLE